MKKTGRKSESDPLRQKSGELVKKRISKPVSQNFKAEDELKESEEKYRLLFENSGEAILLTNPDGTIYSANPAACRIFDMSEDEICKVGRTGIVDLNDPLLGPALNERIKTGRSKTELNLLRKDGTKFSAEVTSTIFRDSSGNKRTSMIIRDISERRKAEKEMHLQSEIMNNLAEGFNLVRLDNEIIVFTNPKFDEMFGYEHGELIGRNISVINATGAKSPDETKQEIVDTVNRSGEWHGEILNIKKNGEHFWCYVNISMFDHADYGKVYLSVHSDINKRKQAEEALHLEKENFRHSLDNSPLGIRIVSADGDTIYANQAILNIYGYDSLEELQKTPLKKRYTPESYAESQIRKQQRNHGDLSTTNYDISIVRKDGRIRHLRVFRKEVLWDGILQFQVIYNDITERKQAEEEIIKSKELLEDLHNHLNEILENERAQISREIHDQIGQSLTALKLDLNWMYKYIRTNPEAVAKLEGMIDLVSNTIKDVQRISSDLRPGILDELGLVSAIEWYCGEFENRTGIKCTLKLDDSDYSNSQINLTFFRALQEALTNVIRHARASSVKVILQQTNQGTTLTIQDNGIGISREEIDSNKSLGLISMHERVKQFNGKIEISSKKGDGTKLTVFIPS